MTEVQYKHPNALLYCFKINYKDSSLKVQFKEIEIVSFYSLVYFLQNLSGIYLKSNFFSLGKALVYKIIAITLLSLNIVI